MKTVISSKRRETLSQRHGFTSQQAWILSSRLRLKCDGTRAETRFRLSAKGTSQFKSAGASVQSTAGIRSVRISGSNAGYTMFRSSVKSTGYPLHSPVSPSLPLPYVTVCHRISTGLYLYFAFRKIFNCITEWSVQEISALRCIDSCSEVRSVLTFIKRFLFRNWSRSFPGSDGCVRSSRFVLCDAVYIGKMLTNVTYGVTFSWFSGGVAGWCLCGPFDSSTWRKYVVSKRREPLARLRCVTYQKNEVLV
jgi:hypothetical protein